ncbi:MAG: dihydroneopterin aldolase [Bacteroidales bacterium]
MNTIIALENMEFYAYHGCFTEERQIGTHFRIDLWMEVDTTLAQKNDTLNDTVNYVAIYQDLKEQMMISSKLIEHVAARILDTIHAKYPMVQHSEIKVSKLNPPLGEKIGCVSVRLKR